MFVDDGFAKNVHHVRRSLADLLGYEVESSTLFQKRSGLFDEAPGNHGGCIIRRVRKDHIEPPARQGLRAECRYGLESGQPVCAGIDLGKCRGADVAVEECDVSLRTCPIHCQDAIRPDAAAQIENAVAR